MMRTVQEESSAAIDEALAKRACGLNFDNRESTSKRFEISELKKNASQLTDRDVERVQHYLGKESKFKKMGADAFRDTITDASELLGALLEADLLRNFGS